MYPSFIEHFKKYGVKNTTLDRIDNNRDYYKENCRWATLSMQHNNTNRCKFLTYKGRTQTISQWGIEFGINKHTLRYYLIRMDWDIGKALKSLAINKNK